MLKIYTLKDQGIISGVTEFTTQYGMARRSIAGAKSGDLRLSIRAEMIAILCQDYNVSLDWIMFGKGKIFGDSNYILKFDFEMLNIRISDIENNIGNLCSVSFMKMTHGRFKNFSKKLEIIGIKNLESKGGIVLKAKLPTGSSTYIDIYSIYDIETLKK